MIFSPAERMIARRYLSTRRSDSFIAVIVGFSLIGIALGVATLIVVTSVMNGVREEMLRHFVGLDGHIHVYSRSGTVDGYQKLAEEIGRFEGVTQVAPVIEGQVMLSANGVARGAQVKAYTPEALAQNRYVQDKIIAGDWRYFLEDGGLLAGERLASAMRLGSDDKLTLISPEGRQTVVGLVPRMKAYGIAGVFKFGMHAIDANLVLMPFAEAQTYFKLNDNGRDGVTGLEVRVGNLDEAAAVAERINGMLNDGYYALSWQSTNAAVFEALNVQRLVMFLILTMIILVAAFNIIASLIMLVKDKHRDIAVLRSIGLTRGQVQRIFMLCGTVIGGLGTLTGLALGLALAYNADAIRLWIEEVTGQPLLGEQLYFLASLPAEVDWMEVSAVVAMAMALSFLATLYPARRAAGLDPAEALRYE